MIDETLAPQLPYPPLADIKITHMPDLEGNKFVAPEILVSGVDLAKYISSIGFSFTADDLLPMVSIDLTIGSIASLTKAQIVTSLDSVNTSLLEEYINLFKQRASESGISVNELLARNLNLLRKTYTIGKETPVNTTDE